MPQLWAIWRWLRAHWPFSRSTSLILRMDNLFLGIVSSMARSPWGVLRQGVGLSRAAWLSGLSNTSFRGVGTCSNRSGIGVQFPSEYAAIATQRPQGRYRTGDHSGSSVAYPTGIPPA